MTIEINGQLVESYLISVDLRASGAPTPLSTAATGPVTRRHFSLTKLERQAVAVLGQSYFDPSPRAERQPLTYAQGGVVLGTSTVAFRKRIESARVKMTAHGVTGLEVGDARAAVVEWCLANDVVTSFDLP